MTRAVIYARFSSEKQTEASIDAQVRACRDYAATRDISIGRVYADEAISGKGSKTAKRAEYQKLLADAKRGLFDLVLVHKYDRIARNVGEHVNLEIRLNENKVRLIAVAQDFGEHKEAKLMRALTWALSEYYIDNLATEVTKGLVETAHKAMHTGGVPLFGYDVVEQKYIINPIEAEYVRKMFQCALDGVGFTDLLAEMKAAGIRGKRGAEIKYTQVYEILRNERYTGVYLYSPQEEERREDRRTKPHAIRIEGGMPAIISKDTYNKVQEIMKDRKQAGAKGDYLCSRLVYCGDCGAKMHASSPTRKGHTYPQYTCSKHCGIGSVRTELVDEAAKMYLHELLTDEVQTEIEKALRQYNRTEKSRVAEHNEIIKKQVADKQRQIDALMGNLSAGVLPPEVVKEIGEKITILKQEKEVLATVEPPRDFTTEQIITWLKSIRSGRNGGAVTG